MCEFPLLWLDLPFNMIFTGEHAVSFKDDTYFCLQYTGDIIEILGFQNPVSYLNEEFP